MLNGLWGFTVACREYSLFVSKLKTTALCVGDFNTYMYGAQYYFIEFWFKSNSTLFLNSNSHSYLLYFEYVQ